jgi:hypothetical protein
MGRVNLITDLVRVTYCGEETIDFDGILVHT